MRVTALLATMAAFVGLLADLSLGQATEEFFQRDFVDAYDEIRQKMESVNEENCGIKVAFWGGGQGGTEGLKEGLKARGLVLGHGRGSTGRGDQHGLEGMRLAEATGWIGGQGVEWRVEGYRAVG